MPCSFIKNVKERKERKNFYKERKRTQERCVLLKRMFAQPCRETSHFRTVLSRGTSHIRSVLSLGGIPYQDVVLSRGRETRTKPLSVDPIPNHNGQFIMWIFYADSQCGLQFLYTLPCLGNFTLCWPQCKDESNCENNAKYESKFVGPLNKHSSKADLFSSWNKSWWVSNICNFS